MRIWDISPERLCRQHLLGEHRELHAIWSIIINNKKGYSNHPEVLRWRGKLNALYIRHEEEVKEMKKRGFNHKSPLEKRLARGNILQKEYVDAIVEQIKIIKMKGCNCKV